MRLTSRYLADIPVLTLTVCDSDYIGTESKAAPIGTIKGRIAPVSDKLSYELYGERMLRMKQLITTDALELGAICEVNGIQYRVISLNGYTAHTVAILELS